MSQAVADITAKVLSSDVRNVPTDMKGRAMKAISSIIKEIKLPKECFTSMSLQVLRGIVIFLLLAQLALVVVDVFTRVSFVHLLRVKPSGIG